MLEELKSIAKLKNELDNLAKHIIEETKNTHTLKEVFHKSKIIKAQDTSTVEILSYRCESFKPTDIKIEVFHEDGNVIPFELIDVRIMGSPQLVNYSGMTVDSDRGLLSFYKETQNIDWQSFGPNAGQGLQITVKNNSQKYDACLYIRVRGYPVSYELLGKV